MKSSRKEESIAGRWRKARVRPHTTARVRRQSTHFTAENLSKAAFITAPPRTPARTRDTLARGVHVDLTWSHLTSMWLYWGVLQTGVLCCHHSSSVIVEEYIISARSWQPARVHCAHSSSSIPCSWLPVALLTGLEFKSSRRWYKKHFDNQSHRSMLDRFT